MARATLSNPVQSNSKLFATTGAHTSKIRPVVEDVRQFQPVEDEDRPNEFERMMLSNRGVL